GLLLLLLLRREPGQDLTVAGLVAAALADRALHARQGLEDVGLHLLLIDVSLPALLALLASGGALGWCIGAESALGGRTGAAAAIDRWDPPGRPIPSSGKAGAAGEHRAGTARTPGVPWRGCRPGDARGNKGGTAWRGGGLGHRRLRCSRQAGL